MLAKATEGLVKVISPTSRVLSSISMVALILVTILVVVDVCLRRFFNSPIHGSHDLTSLAFSMVVFLPLAWCAMQDGHVGLNILVIRLPKTARMSIEVLMTLITSVIIGLMSWQLLAQGTVLQSSNAETGILEIPMYPFIYLATLGSFILMFAFFLKFLHSIMKITGERR